VRSLSENEKAAVMLVAGTIIAAVGFVSLGHLPVGASGAGLALWGFVLFHGQPTEFERERPWAVGVFFMIFCAGLVTFVQAGYEDFLLTAIIIVTTWRLARWVYS
jgi:hypothetical protein